MTSPRHDRLRTLYDAFNERHRASGELLGAYGLTLSRWTGARRLLAVRLLADGVWFADAAGVFAPDPQERARVRAVADELLEG